MKDITLHAKWLIKAPLKEVFNIITDLEKWPESFPKVAESVRIIERKGDYLQIEAIVKSFGSKFPVKMRTQILPEKGFISDNENPKFGVSGHEEFLLSENQEGTMIDYTYQVLIHKTWLRIIAKPLIGCYSMKYWEKAVIDQLRKLVER
ncbi:MAG TPA: SRPBCC family protein [Candidatus Portnoybacteria bacterium]|nr:SRPBCC family protein [Candidatus Portnoybacteria bacterium]